MVRFVITSTTPRTDKTSSVLFFVYPITVPVIEQDLLAFLDTSSYRDVFQSAKDDDARLAFRLTSP